MSIDKKIAELLGESTLMGEEQLDELSKGTLGSYTKAAAGSIAVNAHKAGSGDNKAFAKVGKRLAGVNKATSKLAKEDCEEDDDYDSDMDDDENEIDEAIKGWKNAHNDLSKIRSQKSSDSKSVALHRLKNDGNESGMHDARKAFGSEAEARKHHENMVQLNPGKKIRHNLYIDGKVVDKLHEKFDDYELDVDMSEDIDALVNGENLTEEFKTKAATIFEAAVISRVKSEVAILEEKFDERLEQEVDEIKEGLVEKVDGYLNYVVEQWMQENEIALENGLKNEILESFISGMKGLFEQHYIEIPEEKSNILEQMQQQINNTELMLNVQLENNIMLSKELTEMKRAALTSELIEGMTHIDAEKFTALSEELAFDDEYSFKHKLQTIKENYFGKKQHAVINESVKPLVTDEVPVTLTEEKSVNPVMARYLRAFNGTK